MKITNVFNLDQSIYNILSVVNPPIKNRFSISDICNPPLMRKLREEHWEELEEDISDKLWMLLGSAVHYIIEKGSPESALTEEKLTTQLGDATIVGKPDLWHERTIKDFKVTSVYSFLLGEKEEWTLQLNLYAWLYQLNGFETDTLEIQAILRDWQKSKSYESDYPPIPFMKQIIEKKPMLIIDRYVRSWLIGYANPTPCTNKERWEKQTTWAVKQDNKKKALRVLNTKEMAEQWIENNLPNPLGITIEERSGEDTRCKNYCSVRTVCPYNIYLDNHSKK